MAASGAKSGFGTTLTIAAGGITEIVGPINGPGMTRGTIDVTSMASDNGYREFIGGLADGGDVTFTLSFIKSVATTLLGFLTDTAQTCVITLPSSLGTITFSGLVTGYTPKSEIEQQVMADVTIKVTGKPVLS